jgi:hypothetical protein
VPLPLEGPYQPTAEEKNAALIRLGYPAVCVDKEPREKVPVSKLPKLPKRVLEGIKKERRKGTAVSRIGRKFGVSAKVVLRILKMGVKARLPEEEDEFDSDE